jgi:hypothetical protein
MSQSKVSEIYTHCNYLLLNKRKKEGGYSSFCILPTITHTRSGLDSRVRVRRREKETRRRYFD